MNYGSFSASVIELVVYKIFHSDSCLKQRRETANYFEVVYVLLLLNTNEYEVLNLQTYDYFFSPMNTENVDDIGYL